MLYRALLCIAILTSCTNKPTIEEVYSECDPLQLEVCALPFPSSFYERTANTPSGVQIAYGPESLPRNRDWVRLDPTAWNERDGHSIGSPVMVFFDEVSLDGTHGHENIGGYADAEAKTVLIDTSTGERVPHWVEVDDAATSDDQRVLILRPAQVLRYSTRYVVGFRGLEKKSGGPVDVSEAFVALRDGVATENWDIEGRRERFEDTVFPALEAQNVPRAELQLAWDFHTASRENTVGRMLSMRDDALDRFGTEGPPYQVTSVEENDCEEGGPIYKTLRGTFTAPLYTEEDGPGTVLTKGPDGMPVYNGDTEVDFIVRIPCSLKEEPEEAFVLQYGHGLLGSHNEATTGWLAKFINKNKYIVVAVSWTGMKAEDRGPITVMVVADPSGFRMIPERSMQGMVEQMGALRMVLGSMAEDEHLIIDGVPLVNASNGEQRGYYGNSQGGIMGGAYFALSPDLHRGVLGVPGTPYSLLLPRSHDFEPFFRIFDEKYEDEREKMLIISGLLEQIWDVADPTAWAWDIANPPSDVGDKQVLLQVAIGDAQVHSLGAHVQARSYGASFVTPKTRAVWGIEEKAPPFDTHAIVEWEYTDIEPEPYGTVPPDVETDPHECPRRNRAGQQQIERFFESGAIEQFCEGPCLDVQATCK